MSDERKKTPARTRRTPAPEPQIGATTPAPKRARAAAPKAPAKVAVKKTEAPAKTRAPRARAAKARPEIEGLASQAPVAAAVEPLPVAPVAEPMPLAPEAQGAAANDTPPAPALPEHELRELISRRATEIWLSHGGMRQGSIEDWLQAEAEVRRTLEGIAS